MPRASFNPRKLMEQTIEVMKSSIPETRDDGKSSPAVGAVLYTADGEVETAYRGELRDGDHAEFTLLERKKRDAKLDGSVLFATLEPCAPGARAEGKLPCAERIVLARIKEVWIGIEDPDPKVDRKGITHLQKHGVTVHMFDRDLQEEIRTVNAKFIAQALERAAKAAEEKEEPIVLTPFENAEPTASLADLSEEALQRFIKDAKLSEKLGSDTLNRRLVLQGLVENQKGNLVPTGYGILLFGKQPRDLLPQAGLLATMHYPNGQIEKQSFDGPMVLIPDEVENWLRSKLPNLLIRSSMTAKEQLPIPIELIRESIINALVHRDYEIKGAKCQLKVSQDSIEIISPGAPLSPITMAQMKSFTAPMLSRNPQLHYVFSQMGLAEERGLGMETLRTVPKDLGLPVPQFTLREPYLVLHLFSNAEGVAAAVEPSALESLNQDEKAGWKYLTTQLISTAQAYAEELGYDERKTQRHLRKFMDLGMIRRLGKGRATHYEVLLK